MLLDKCEYVVQMRAPAQEQIANVAPFPNAAIHLLRNDEDEERR